MTGYVASRWYRAPEILLGSTNYSESSDIWSLGCIFAEMITGDVLFRGSSTLDQLEKIFSCLHLNENRDLPGINSPVAPTLLLAINPKPGKNLEALIPNEQDNLLNLIQDMLRINPERRITAIDAIKHPSLSSFLVEEPVLKYILTLKGNI